MSAKHEWLNLLEVSGPFLAVPVLREVFPQGLEELDTSRAKRLRSAYEEWRDAVDADDADLEKLHAAWIDEVLRTALEADDQLLKAGKAVPASVVNLPEHDTTITPELVFVDPTQGGAPLAPVHVFPPDTDISASMKFGGLSCSPGDRMALHLRALNKPFGLVTNGERWMLVHAPTGQVATFVSWYARIWGQEPATLRAFASLLGVRRFFAPEQDRLPALFERSLKHQDEVTDALGDQVRRAIEVLVQALDRADQDRNRELLRDVKPQELYEAGLTVMMRLVFLLAAEERRLLLLGEPRYDSFYAVSTLRMQLRTENDEILERRRAAWSRLLAVFRAVFGGIDHPTLRLPTMGGSLFDPDRFPFLEGRLKGTSWRQHRAEPLPIDDRTVLLLLEAIQTFEGRTLSYRALDVEQIGHVYEGLLERTVARVEDVTLELEAGAQAKDARVTLGELESKRLDGKAAVTSLLVERSKRSQSAIEKELAAKVEPQQSARLLSACRGDVKLRDRLQPYVRLLRTDPWGYPLVHPKGAFVVVLGADRRETGTHYTPKSLTERIVEETLTPLVYDGPAKGAPRAEWKLKTPEQLLDLKVCDPAMGSGAFLVQACRFLSARLVEAWAIEEGAGRVVDLTGQVHEPRTSVESMPPGVEVRAENARRIVAERCLYGVDLNPLAVELAKLSLWLVTLSKGRPFGFLDHNLRRGDSLLGISRLEQLTELTLDPSATRQARLFGKAIERAVAEAVELRRKLHEIPIRDIRDVEAMATLDADARKKLKAAELLADAFIGVVFAAEGSEVLERRLSALASEADRVVKGEERATESLTKRTHADLAKDALGGVPRRPFHWPLEFPDVFHRDSPGFDAIVGNPPFLGGRRISTVMGGAYNTFLAKLHPPASGNTDLVAHFFRRAFGLLRGGGIFGLLATKTIAEGDTRQGGLEWMTTNGAVIIAAYPNEPWPGKAAVVTSCIHVCKGEWLGRRHLCGRTVPTVSAFLSGNEDWSPKPLRANAGISFQGSIVLGMGFVLPPDEAQRMLAADPRNAEVIFPYLNGDDLNSDPQQNASRWVINFWDWPEKRASSYREPYVWLKTHVYPERLEKSKEKSYSNIMSMWWLYWRHRPEFYRVSGARSFFEQSKAAAPAAKRTLSRVIAITRHTKTVAFTFVPTSSVFSDATVVFALDSSAHLAVLQSSIHVAFAWQHSSRLKSDLRYSPTDAFETYPLPEAGHMADDSPLFTLGEEYQRLRGDIMRADGIGLTKLYRRFHTVEESDERILRLRDLHRRIDETLVAAYGWNDLHLMHGFYDVAYLPENDRHRFTMSEAARVEVLQRLGELNRQRYEEEQAAAPATKPRSTKGRATTAPAGQGALALAEAPAPATTSKTKAAAPAKKASTRRTSR
ncbi:type IIL restriction-modification enzyme MmeI [Vitiosangium sp. GDMCC 1.1324]|uniref:Eco57I restriction-modification methylase domain-containing protein n=1 Tax=Vitiosangium sp. (strain GDMCC 1.1324) TaxID=2138576 RepID=UPI000D3D451D|nr:type IIL restriction-modification enzyme MmeI [Vitiosangium sp. GDMCC 1.1324]PTL78071.1 ATP phosphoribosyltransferase regulatory subunit [Vitiosangium sp. GDMCC 1.1324]